MDRLDLVDASRNRQYLLEKTQHIVGGFGKGVGEPPGKIGGNVSRCEFLSFINGHPTDLLHSYFGLVSLAFQGEPGLSLVDPTLCSSHRAVQHLHSLSWWQDYCV